MISIALSSETVRSKHRTDTKSIIHDFHLGPIMLGFLDGTSSGCVSRTDDGGLC